MSVLTLEQLRIGMTAKVVHPEYASEYPDPVEIIGIYRHPTSGENITVIDSGSGYTVDGWRAKDLKAHNPKNNQMTTPTTCPKCGASSQGIRPHSDIIRLDCHSLMNKAGEICYQDQLCRAREEAARMKRLFNDRATIAANALKQRDEAREAVKEAAELIGYARLTSTSNRQVYTDWLRKHAPEKLK